jgi:hypothetical protein
MATIDRIHTTAIIRVRDITAGIATTVTIITTTTLGKGRELRNAKAGLNMSSQLFFDLNQQQALRSCATDAEADRLGRFTESGRCDILRSLFVFCSVRLWRTAARTALPAPRTLPYCQFKAG